MFLLTGAVEYCPPEALSEPKYYAVPTNVWALGITLYLMVNRRLPFSHVQEILKASPNSWKSSVSISEETDAMLIFPYTLIYQKVFSYMS